jgi:hypothetical protein
MWYLRVLRGRPLSCMTSRWCSRDAGDPPSSERTLDSFGRTVPLGLPRSRPVVSGKHDFLTSLLGFVLVIRKLGRPGPAGHLVGVVRHDRHAGGPAGAGDRLAVAHVGEAAERTLRRPTQDQMRGDWVRSAIARCRAVAMDNPA